VTLCFRVGVTPIHDGITYFGPWFFNIDTHISFALSLFSWPIVFFNLSTWSLVCCFYYYHVCVFAMDNNEFMIVVGTIVLLIEFFLHIWESPNPSTIFTFWFWRFNFQTLIANVFFFCRIFICDATWLNWPWTLDYK
jgi:hypothetical protein